MDIPVWVWFAFLAGVMVMLALDLVFLHYCHPRSPILVIYLSLLSVFVCRPLSDIRNERVSDS